MIEEFNSFVFLCLIALFIPASLLHEMQIFMEKMLAKSRKSCKLASKRLYMVEMRKYPVGIQTFSRIIREWIFI